MQGVINIYQKRRLYVFTIYLGLISETRRKYNNNTTCQTLNRDESKDAGNKLLILLNDLPVKPNYYVINTSI